MQDTTLGDGEHLGFPRRPIIDALSGAEMTGVRLTLTMALALALVGLAQPSAKEYRSRRYARVGSRAS